MLENKRMGTERDSIDFWIDSPLELRRFEIGESRRSDDGSAAYDLSLNRNRFRPSSTPNDLDLDLAGGPVLQPTASSSPGYWNQYGQESGVNAFEKRCSSFSTTFRSTTVFLANR